MSEIREEIMEEIIEIEIDETENELVIRDLYVEYRTDDGVVKALNGLDLTIGIGKTVGLVGETGAGKTTTGLSVLKLVPDPPGVIVDGSIILAGRDIMKLSEREMGTVRGKAVSMIFQDPMTSLNPVITVEEQIAEVIRHHENVNKSEGLERAHQMLELVSIPRDRGKEYPHQFSGGMQQRVMIAIALACSPKLLIADEPTTALDVTIQAQVLKMMRELRDKYETSMLMITHDLGIVAEICDTVAVMYAGRVIEYGNLEDIFEKTKHPYTIGLFNSLPNLEDRAAKLIPIKGLMPDPMDLPTGCPFHPRCDFVMDICKDAYPDRIYRTDEHYVECHKYTTDSINGLDLKQEGAPLHE